MKDHNNIATKRPATILAAVCVLALMASAGKAGATTLLAGNLGPGNSYQTGTGNSWADGGPDNTSNAVSFTTTSGQDFTLDSIQFADNWFVGIDTLHIGFLQGSDLNSAMLLESFTVSAPTMFNSYLYTVNSVSNPLILAGNTYFITQFVTDPSGATTWGWQVNDQGQTGYFAQIGTAGWFAETGDTPAFAVYGSPVAPPPVPEPSSIVLFGTGLASAAVQLRRRLKRSA
jgi:hypothetical protein